MRCLILQETVDFLKHSFDLTQPEVLSLARRFFGEPVAVIATLPEPSGAESCVIVGGVQRLFPDEREHPCSACSRPVFTSLVKTPQVDILCESCWRREMAATGVAGEF